LSTCCVVLLHIIHGYHSTTLFPYTTLFRSQNQFLPIGKGGLAFRRHIILMVGIQHNPSDHLGLGGISRNKGITILSSFFKGNGIDRKSTRLNSSHVKISYAVFCLKKKKTRA